jgi:hypothetical protein
VLLWTQDGGEPVRRSAQFWEDRSDNLGKNTVETWFHRAVFDDSARGIGGETVVVIPVDEGPDGSGTETAAAIRTNVVQDVFDAGPAEGAFKGADHRGRRTWRKSCIAVLAGGPEFEHNKSFEVKGRLDGQIVQAALN